MAHYGVGPSGYILTTDGEKQVWSSGDATSAVALSASDIIANRVFSV